MNLSSLIRKPLVAALIGAGLGSAKSSGGRSQSWRQPDKALR